MTATENFLRYYVISKEKKLTLDKQVKWKN